MLSLEKLKEELHAEVPRNVPTYGKAREVKSYFVGENLAWALKNVGEKVIVNAFCSIWVTNYIGESPNYLLDYLLESSDLQDFNIQVCRIGAEIEVYNRKNGKILFVEKSGKVENVITAFKQYFKDFIDWSDVAEELEAKSNQSYLTDDYLVNANFYHTTEFDNDVLAMFDEENEVEDEYDYDDLYNNHIYCIAPLMLLKCENFKEWEEEAVTILEKEMPDYVSAWLVSDYLAEKLVDAGEFVVRLDDCNVWESESDNYDLKGQLKYILER